MGARRDLVRATELQRRHLLQGEVDSKVALNIGADQFLTAEVDQSLVAESTLLSWVNIRSELRDIQVDQ